MKQRFILSTYIVRISNSNQNLQLLEKFNQNEDFLNFLKKYLDFILVNPQKKFNDEDNSSKLHLTLRELPTLDMQNRVIYGKFQGGVSGADLTIRDLDLNEDVLKVDKNKHGSFRELFFYFKIPSSSTNGYLVVQRIGKYGVKGIVVETVNKYLKSLGYMDSKFTLVNVIHGKVFKEMIKYGSLKKVEFVKKVIPKTLEGFMNNKESFETEKGVLTTTIQSHTSLGESWKNFVNNTVGTFRDNRTRIEVEEKEYDEIEFELELNGKKKTFYANCQNRVQPDVDVYKDLTYENGIPTIKSLIEKSEELINDLIEMKPNV